MFEQDYRRQWISGAPKKATKLNLSMIGVTKEPLGEADGLLTRCFRAIPHFLDLFPHERV
jgi:hypothetical protein